MRASGYDRQAQDFYREPGFAVVALLDAVPFVGSILDPACGSGTIPKICKARGHTVQGSDLVDRGYGTGSLDFLRPDYPLRGTNIICNPPYRCLRRWVDLSLARTTGRVAVLARLAFLEGQDRMAWFATVPLARVLVSAARLSMPPGDQPDIEAAGGAIAYGWFIFEHGHEGAATINWFDKPARPGQRRFLVRRDFAAENMR